MRCFLFLLGILVCSCNVMISHPEYRLEGEENSTWIHLDKDTLSDMSFYISVPDSQVMVHAVFYDTFGKLDQYQKIVLDIPGLVAKNDSMEFELREEGGAYERTYFDAADLASVTPELKKMNYSKDSLVSLVSSRRFTRGRLPEKLQLRYTVVTADTSVTGSFLFTKIAVETPTVMRWH